MLARNVTTARDLRHEALYAMANAQAYAMDATKPQPFRSDLRVQQTREACRWARRARIFLRAADRLDQLAGCASDGFHFADGQLFHVQHGRPEPHGLPALWTPAGREACS